MNKVTISAKTIMMYTQKRTELKRTVELKHSIEVFNSRQERERKTSENSKNGQ